MNYEYMRIKKKS